jgi:hypothetical protein
MTLNLERLDRSVLAPGGQLEAEPKDHFVELYDDDDASMLETVRTFLSVAVIQGNAAVLIATPSHREELEEALGRSADLQDAREEDRFIALDAEQTLAAFMEDGLPDPDKFYRTVGEIIERAAANSDNVRVFGEMVVMLWEQGNVDGALALEDLWNKLAERHEFRLFCAYPTRLFEGDDLSPITEVCARHSAVLTAQAG